MKPASGKAALRFQERLRAEFGPAAEALEFESSTRTAAEAAAAIGCAPAQIIKSLVFKTESGQAVLIAASGPIRVSEAKAAEALGEPIGRADPAFVRAATGFAIGGVPPFGHPERLTTLIDATLAEQGPLWAAAGAPTAVFTLSFEALVRATGGRVVDLQAA